MEQWSKFPEAPVRITPDISIMKDGSGYDLVEVRLWDRKITFRERSQTGEMEYRVELYDMNPAHAIT